jgi:hypothetical protein
MPGFDIPITTIHKQHGLLLGGGATFVILPAARIFDYLHCRRKSSASLACGNQLGCPSQDRRTFRRGR